MARPDASLGEVLRSLAFYGIFYSGTVVYVLASLTALLFGRGPFITALWRGWCGLTSPERPLVDVRGG